MKTMVVDPAPFLSTIAASSAAMVAIVGGLLVARFVTLISEREGAQQVLDDAKERLSTAHKRAKETEERLVNWDVGDFFDRQVLHAIGDGTKDMRELRAINGSARLPDEKIASVVSEVAAEFETARNALPGFIQSTPEGARVTHAGWEDFKAKTSGLPETSWDEVWEIVYIDLLTPPQPRAPAGSIFGDFPLSVPLIPPVPQYVALGEQRRDALRANLDRAQQQEEDIEGEVGRLQPARDAIVRPKGLGWGLVVLSVFTVVGVINPVWLMSRAPERLSAHMGEAVFWLFFIGLLALLVYMSTLALRLSGWRWNRKK
jgi:hypothetical protein